MNRTFIVEDDAEDDFVQWAKNEVTGEQGYIDDERSCFWTWDDNEYPEWRGLCLVVQRKERQLRLGGTGNDGFEEGGFRLCQPDKGAKDYTQNKGKVKDQKGKGQGRSLSSIRTCSLRNPMKKDMAMPGNRTTGLPAMGLTSPGLQLLGGFGGNPFEPCQPSNTRGSGLWPHTVD